MLSQQPYVVTPQKKNLILPQKTETNTSDRENLREVFLSQGFDNDTVDGKLEKRHFLQLLSINN